MFSGMLKRLGFRVKDERGLTLIELVAVVVILGIVAVLLVPRVTGRAEEARVNAALSDIAAMKSVIDVYYADEGEMPDSSNIADVMQDGGINWTGAAGGVTDPWGRGYGYEVNTTDDTYTIASQGKDAGDGGGDEIYATDKISPTKDATVDITVTSDTVSNGDITGW